MILFCLVPGFIISCSNPLSETKTLISIDFQNCMNKNLRSKNNSSGLLEIDLNNNERKALHISKDAFVKVSRVKVLNEPVSFEPNFSSVHMNSGLCKIHNSIQDFLSDNYVYAQNSSYIGVSWFIVSKDPIYDDDYELVPPHYDDDGNIVNDDGVKSTDDDVEEGDEVDCTGDGHSNGKVIKVRDYGYYVDSDGDGKADYFVDSDGNSNYDADGDGSFGDIGTIMYINEGGKKTSIGVIGGENGGEDFDYIPGKTKITIDDNGIVNIKTGETCIVFNPEIPGYNEDEEEYNYNEDPGCPDHDYSN